MSGVVAAVCAASPIIRVTMTPGAQTATGNTASRAFSESITVTGGTPASYTWSLSNLSGSWSITAGQGTASATATVSSASIGPDYTCDFNCAVVVNGVTYNVTGSLDYTRLS